MRRSRALPFLALTALATIAVLTGCVPEPGTSPTASPGSSASSPTTATTSPVPSAAPSETADATTAPTSDEIALPASCDALYSASMRAELDANVAPLGDERITMLSTEDGSALDLLASGAPTLRCTWGVPSDTGISTNVTIVTAAESAALAEAFRNAGFGETPAASGTVFVTEKEFLDTDDNIVRTGESHFLRGNGWIATRWLTYFPDGYTEDVATSLWN